MGLRYQATIRGPPKAVFQFLCEVEALSEISAWKVACDEGKFDVGFSWDEKKLLKTVTWTVSEFDRRGLRFVATSDGLKMEVAAKKGGTGSCNAVMKISGEEKAEKWFEQTHNERLSLLAGLVNG